LTISVKRTVLPCPPGVVWGIHPFARSTSEGSVRRFWRWIDRPSGLPSRTVGAQARDARSLSTLLALFGI
jgi:hypothetical protein